MFKKKIRCRCGRKVDSTYSFCPFCGAQLKEIKKIEEQHDRNLGQMEKSFEEAFQMPFFVRLPFKKIIRDLDKQFRQMDKVIGGTQIKKQENKGRINNLDIRKLPTNVQGISIKVETSSEGQPIIKVGHFSPGQKIKFPTAVKKTKKNKEEKSIKLPKKKLTKAQKEKLKKLPREEPQTKVRRLTDKIVYEIILPGIKSEKDIIITKLENSIEIKAFTKNKAYFKLIPLSLPIKNYFVEKGKLILELKP